MSLAQIWKTTPEQLRDKSVQQVLAFAGNGVLRDNSDTSHEFREFLRHIGSDRLEAFAEQCLSESFKDGGLALQDIVNQVGYRLGFSVIAGMYRGTSKAEDIGFDGLWEGPDGSAIIVEVKTTDAYRMSLDTVATYRRKLIACGKAKEPHSSILYIVGRNDTGDLEAQVRGSRHAWDIRLISIQALLRLMKLKEELNDPEIMRKIREILTPLEFTRVDRIIDLVFSAAEGVKQEDIPEELTVDPSPGAATKKLTPVQFRAGCIDRISKKLGESLVKRTASIYSNPGETIGLCCSISKTHVKTYWNQYWFAFQPNQKVALEAFGDSYVCFGCGSADNILLIPSKVFLKWLRHFNTTEDGEHRYWHVHLSHRDSRWEFHAKGENARFDASKYFLQ